MQIPKTPTEQKVNNISDAQAMIRGLNDDLRIHGRGGRVLMTSGVDGLEANRKQRVIQAIRSYNNFSADNDPYGEHDFGEVEVDGQAVMFKIDYYDLAGRNHSPDASDPSVTLRVMTLMLSDEY